MANKPKQFVRVLTKHLILSTDQFSDVDGEMTHKTIDWNNSSDRKWLMNHFHWAMNNQHVVLVRPIF